MGDSRRNGDGYYDPTAYIAIKRVMREERNYRDYERFKKMLDAINSIADAAGFSVENRIVLKDKKTGRVWK